MCKNTQWVVMAGGTVKGLKLGIRGRKKKSQFEFPMNDSAFHAILYIFITVSSTLGKRKGGKK